MTRTDDRYLSLQDRVDIGHEAQTDLFISIHANAAANELAQGIEIFYYPNSAVADTALEFAAHCFAELCAISPWEDRAVKEAGFHVLRENNAPAILVELGFLTNEEELANLSSSLYRSAQAKALFEAVMNARTAK